MTTLLHDIWQAPDGSTTMLCLAGERGVPARQLLSPDAQKIHSFYAASHFEGMTQYYAYMGWGVYTTEFEQDKAPYSSENFQP